MSGKQERLAELAAWAQDSAGADPLADDILEALAQLRAANERAAVSEEHNEGLARVLGCGSQHYKVAAAVILLMHRAEEAEAKLAAVPEHPKGCE